MPTIPGFVLVHRARVVRTARAGSKDVQGERVGVQEPGPWFPARRMSPRPSKDPRDPGGRRRSEARFQLLWGDEYEDGTALTDPPRSSDSVEVEVLGEVVRYRAEPRPLEAGEEAFGGLADLLEVGDTA